MGQLQEQPREALVTKFVSFNVSLQLLPHSVQEFTS